jgi:asparagine synthase (glutamine-hydrolysing)
MCGIAGSINYSLNIPRLTKDLWHRGPDEQNTYEEDNVQLHHHRLSIVDIAGGHQPMHFNHLTIVFNGEIYNHKELREKHSLSCSSNSDTETLLHLYNKLGKKLLDELDGMFAFVIYDKNKKQLFMARDRAGKKPLYYYFNGSNFVFSSELSSLRNQLNLNINNSNIDEFLRLGHFYKTSTPYEKVWELEAGSYAEVAIDSLKIDVTKWFNIHDFYKQRTEDSFEAAINKLDEKLHTSVKRRVESSDLEVGSFLSGGIDSGIVTSVAKGYNSSLKTFTVSFNDEYDEAPLAKLVADKYDTEHHEIKISFDNLQNDVENILSNYGEPFFDSSAIPSYYVSKAAKQYLTVVLNGDGADELFGGYRRYVPFNKYDFFSSGVGVRALSSLAHSILPASNNKKSKYNYLYRLTNLSRKKGINTYLSATIDSFEGFEKYFKTSGELLAPTHDFELVKGSSLSGLQKLMNLDFDFILAGNLLVKMDIATMSQSLEGRSPLLSKELLEYIPTLPDGYKINGSETKFLLRTLAKKYLPSELINQPKRGFEIPLKKWIDGELRTIISDYLFAPNAYYVNFIDSSFVNKLWNRKISVGDEKRAKMIWSLFALEVWYKKCYLN